MFGIGLRPVHYPYLENRPQTKLDWFEAISENYMDTEGRPLKMLELIRKDYPVALHGVGLSIGSSSDLNFDYLKKLKKLTNHIEPFIVSDHLCWTSTATHQIHDLLPFPFNEETLALIVNKIHQVQDYLNRTILIENISAYISFKNSIFQESEFLNEIVKRTGCSLLFDLNNLYVNSQNHKFNPFDFIELISRKNIGQIHLAGHTDTGEYLFDTHSKEVCHEVWDLYEYLISKIENKIPTIIEWDADIPDFQLVEQQAMIAKEKWLKIYANARDNAKSFCSIHYIEQSRP